MALKYCRVDEAQIFFQIEKIQIYAVTKNIILIVFSKRPKG